MLEFGPLKCAHFKRTALPQTKGSSLQTGVKRVLSAATGCHYQRCRGTLGWRSGRNANDWRGVFRRLRQARKRCS